MAGFIQLMQLWNAWSLLLALLLFREPSTTVLYKLACWLYIVLSRFMFSLLGNMKRISDLFTQTWRSKTRDPVINLVSTRTLIDNNKSKWSLTAPQPTHASPCTKVHTPLVVVPLWCIDLNNSAFFFISFFCPEVYPWTRCQTSERTGEYFPLEYFLGAWSVALRVRGWGDFLEFCNLHSWD